jgi:hypothetical protein
MDTTLIVLILGIALLAIVALPSLLKKKSDAAVPPARADTKPATPASPTDFKPATADDIDRIPLARWLCEQVCAQTGIDVKRDPMALTRIMEAANKARADLDANDSTEISLPYIAADAKGPRHFQIVVTRDKVAMLRGRLMV